MKTLDDESELKRLLFGLPEEECCACGLTNSTVVDCYVEMSRPMNPSCGLVEHWLLCLSCRTDGFCVDEGDGVACSMDITKVHRAEGIPPKLVQPAQPA